MKKTEKIEVRVSVEEKERLGKMAERRGQSVSDMIRERMSEDVGAIPKNMKMNRMISMLALLLAILALLWLAIVGFKSKKSDYPIMSTIGFISIDPYARLGSFNVPHIDSYSQRHKIYAFEHDFEVSLRVEKKEDGLFMLMSNICKKVEARCVNSRENETILSSPLKTPSFSQFVYNGEDGEKIDISIKGPRLQTLPVEKTQ